MSRVVTFASVILFVTVLVASSARAQTIFEPVRYQYGHGGGTFYYGGSDPAVFHMGHGVWGGGGRWGRVNGWAFASGDLNVHREVSTEPVRVFTDAIPRQNAHLYGFTPADAMNEAYHNVPRYFRKADLMASGHADSSGAWVVPSIPRMSGASGTMTIQPYVRRTPTTTTASQPKRVIIIPKDMLDKTIPVPPGGQVTMAE